MSRTTSRRGFLAASAAAVGATQLSSNASADHHAEAAEQPAAESATGLSQRAKTYASIGVGIQGQGLMGWTSNHSTCVAICDVDTKHLEQAKAKLEKIHKDKNKPAADPDLYEDYHRVLERDDIDALVIATPDHWHAKMVIEALRAGKDIYCEKPLTLTIDEGLAIEKVAAETGRVLAIGAWQRSVAKFQTACALARSGRLGAMKRVTCGLDGSPTSPALPVVAPFSTLNWNRWLGPAPYVPFVCAPEVPPQGGYGNDYPHGRSHRHFRWWYEYSGGKLTDWGAHHVDIAMWGLDKTSGDIGVYTLDPLMVEHPMEFVDGNPTEDDKFNTATKFHVRVTFEDGIELDIRHGAREDLGFGNGIMFQGEDDRFFVNRGKITGKPVEAIEADPLPMELYKSLHPEANPKGIDHMGNFFKSARGKSTPITDLATHNRSLEVCHAANIVMRLGRKLRFDSATRRFVGDDQANSFLSRPYREGFEIGA